MWPSSGISSFVGHGYDVTGDYLAPSSVRPAVVDVAKLPAGDYTVLTAPAYNSGETYVGENAGALLSDLMANIGEDMGSGNRDYYFTATLGEASSNSSFVMDTQWQRAVIAGFPGLSSTVSRALSDAFIADMSLLTADALVKKYGTHFITRASAGLAVRQIYSAYYPDAEAGFSPLLEGFRTASSAIVGTYNGILSDKLASLYNYGARLNVTFIGGDTGGISFDEQDQVLGSRDAWWQSGDEANYGLIAIQDLYPLSLAINDKQLSDQVDEAVKRHIAEAQTTLETLLPLFQNTDGSVYRYVTSAEASSALDKTGIRSYGVLGALSAAATDEAPLPLYSNVETDGNQVLSLIQPTIEWKRLGYVSKERHDSSVPLYEISDGSRYAYTIEAANSYGKKNEWHPTGAVFYLLRP